MGGHFIIRSPGIVFLMNEFEKCGYRPVAQTSDKSGFIRVTMHIKNKLNNNITETGNNNDNKEINDEIIINNDTSNNDEDVTM
jgi:hypothetical protein